MAKDIATWDRERIEEALKVYDVEAAQGVDALYELVKGVRAEAIGWTWAEACSQYDKGLDVRHQLMPELLDKALADLNPERK